MEENKKIKETLAEMEARINEINSIADERIKDASKESAKQINEIRNNTIEVIENAIKQIKSTVEEDDIAYNFKFEEFLNRVINRSKEASNYTIDKIKEYSDNSKIEEKINEASQQINDAFDKLISNDDIQNAYDKTKSFTKKSIDDVNDYFSNRDYQKHLDNFSDTLVSSIHAFANGLEKLLKSDEVKEEEKKEEENLTDFAEEVKEDITVTKETIFNNKDKEDNKISIDDISVDEKE